MKIKSFCVLAFLCFCANYVMAQSPITRLQAGSQNTALDTLLSVKDLSDTIAPEVVNVRYANDSIGEPISYAARDSMIYDILNERVYLYGRANVLQGDMELKGEFIIIDNKDNTVIAEAGKDSLGRASKASFKDGTQSFTADRMKYNFKTKKGKIYGGRTEQGDGVLYATEGKFMAKTPENGRENDIAFSKGGLYTTCKADHPHFGIYSSRQKVIPNKLVVVGPSNLVVGDIPTPLWMPFGFFPITQGRRNGLVLPRDYKYSERFGYGLLNVGYYWGISDNMDLLLSTDLYTRGSWGVSATMHYNKKYRYSGTLKLSTSHSLFEIPNSSEVYRQQDFSIQASLQQQAGAHPTRNIGGSIDIATATNNRTVTNDANNRLANQLTSNFMLRQTFPGKPFQLTAGLTHSQNTQTRTMNISFPNVNFNVNRIQPFKRKEATGTDKWYEKIGFSYSGQFKSGVQTYDTLLFKRANWGKLKNDVQIAASHSIPVDASFTVLKYFNVVPRMSYDENWFFTKNKRTFSPDTIVNQRVVLDNLGNPTGEIAQDSTFGTVNKSIEYGFTPVRDFDAGVNINTQIFGTLNFKKGYLRALRHVVRPTIGYTFSPENTNKWLQDSVLFDNRRLSEYQYYGYLDNMPYSTFSHSRQETLNFGFSNVLEAKVKSRRDTTGELRKVPLISNLSINSSYNFAADTLKMGFVSMNATTNLLKMVNLTLSARFDPYRSLRGQRINRFYWDTDGKILNFRSGSLNASTDIRPEKLLSLLTKKNNDTPVSKTKPTKGVIQNMYVSYNLNVESRYNSETGKDSLQITTNDISINGNFNISNKWQFNIGRIGYDFSRKRVTYPDLSFSRNLHCWEMGMSWYPELHTYTFFLRVTPGSLDFLKIPFKKARYDGTDPFIIR